MYSHAYKDTNTILLGFGDGSIHSFDLRTKRTTLLVEGGSCQIGEIRFDHQNKMFAAFGTPTMTLYHYNDSVCAKRWKNFNFFLSFKDSTFQCPSEYGK